MTAKKSWNVKVASNPGFCGVDVGGVQFANGEAVVEDRRLARWFEEHDGYEVEPVAPPKPADQPKQPSTASSGKENGAAGKA